MAKTNGNKNWVSLEDFARRVERLCDFLLSKTERNGSDNVAVLEKLKDEAADFQQQVEVDVDIDGLKDYMSGTPATGIKE